MKPKLTSAFVRNAKPRTMPDGRRLAAIYPDGGDRGHLTSYGLRLVVSPYGRGRYVQRLWFAGKQRDVPIGSTLLVTLKEARAKVRANWECARQGGDPTRRRAKPTNGDRPVCPTFSEGLEAVIKLRHPNPKAGRNKRKQMDNHAAALMGVRLDDLNASAILDVLTPIWAAKNETAKQVKGTIGHVVDWAIGKEIRADNPVPALVHALTKVDRKAAPRPAVQHAAAASALRRIHKGKAAGATKMALEFLMLTAARSGEAQGALWSEIDLDAGLWVIPASRMKAKETHRVPLSSQAVALLRKARKAFGGEGGSVFPGAKATAYMRELALASDQPGKVAVAHGFRSSFSTWANELSGASHYAIEISLAHNPKGDVEGRYNRTELLEQRRELMQAWADYLTK